ncbi:MAG: glycosyltransferase family 1 protein [Patescibacteria group bacterium]|nr:glycosyltransferase family 1 protein [Patescibacteria group bacterium]
MRIALDVRCLMNRNYSGVAEYTYNLLNNLFEQDKENQYKLFYNSKSDVLSQLPKFDFPNVKYYGFNFSNKLFNLGLKFLKYPKIDELIGGADIFFIPNLNFFASSKKCKLVITMHDLSFKLYPHFFSLKRRLWHKLINAKKLASSCDKIISDSKNTKNDLTGQYDISPNKIKVIGLGVDNEIYHVIDKNDSKLIEVKNKYALPENFLLFLGTIEPRKNIEGIIEAFTLAKRKYPELKTLNLIVAGEPGWKNKNVFAAVKKSIFKDQTKFIGYVSREDKVYLYNLAKTLIFPSFYEGFGLPIIEAQACGIPIITSSDSSLVEIAQNSALLVNPDEVGQLAKAINEIISNENLRTTLITNGRKNCARFTWQKCARETLEYLLK